jgi:hypothetical protein
MNTVLRHFKLTEVMRRGLAAAGLLLLLVSSAKAGLTPPSFTNTPENSWRYSELLDAGHGQSTTYFPTTYGEYQNAVFQGYVTYNHGVPPSDWYGQGFDTIQVFSTYLLSHQDLTLPLIEGADDGHSLFVNHQFVGGGGFGSTVMYTLSLSADVPRLFEVVGYNGPGPWEFDVAVQANGDVLNNVPGLRINADGQFVPEPSSLIVMVLVGLMLSPGLNGVLRDVIARSPRDNRARLKG